VNASAQVCLSAGSSAACTASDFVVPPVSAVSHTLTNNSTAAVGLTANGFRASLNANCIRQSRVEFGRPVTLNASVGGRTVRAICFNFIAFGGFLRIAGWADSEPPLPQVEAFNPGGERSLISGVGRTEVSL
jgi:hypothetical protein